jgi:outer membrane protein assembly factor BamB
MNRWLSRYLGSGLIVLALAFLTGCQAVEWLKETGIRQTASLSERYRMDADQLAASDRKAEAILTYRQAVEADPKNEKAQQRLGSMYAEQGRKRLGLRYLNKAFALNGQSDAIKAEIEKITTSLKSDTAPLTQVWQTAVGESEPAGTALFGERLAVSLRDGILMVLNSQTGNAIWQIKQEGFSSGPALNDKYVVVGNEKKVFLFDIKSGALVWKSEIGSPLYATPLLADSFVYCPGMDGVLYAIDIKDGTLRWSFKTGGSLVNQPVAAGKNLFFGSQDGRLYALEAESGQPFWAGGFVAQGTVESIPLVLDGRVYFGSNDSRVYALEEKSGGEFWRYSTSDNVYATPVMAGGRLFVVSTGQSAAALNPLNGDVLWEVDTKNPVKETPLVYKNQLLFTCLGDPMLYAFDVSNGQLVWSLDTGDWAASGPLQEGENIILLGKDGTVTAYQLK